MSITGGLGPARTRRQRSSGGRAMSSNLSAVFDRRLVVAVALALAVTSCSKKQEESAAAGTPAASEAAPAATPVAEVLEGQLDIVAWPGYIERGESDKAYDWVTGFEKETGCKVNVKTAGTSDEMVSLMTQGGYDLVTASGDATLRLIGGERCSRSTYGVRFRTGTSG